MAGKTNYFGVTGEWATLWKSYNHPPEVPNVTYIYEELVAHASCWSFGVASNVQTILNEEYQELRV